MIYNLKRFIDAQVASYDRALAEIKDGHKCSHWMWYIFPQLKGLGHSHFSEYYGIENLDEARAYLEDETLGTRLREITEAFYGLSGTPKDIMGVPDHVKLKSCMTLFDAVSPDDIFNDVLEKFYEGKRCRRTLKKLSPIS